ncbi:MAG: MarR family winged helix-turn-helix transcriptional regulator [Ktedonobacterales bacterium]
MSSGHEEKRTELLRELVQELRQSNGLGASFFRAAAGRTGMTVTDMQVIDILDSTGPATAGQLADLTGLTTGAITGILSRLEEAGLVRRERDPNDGRRVIVRLAKGKDELGTIGPIFDSIGRAWDDMASDYDDEQLASLLAFLKRSNAASKREILRLREAPEGAGGNVSAPLGDVASGQLIVSSGISRLTLGTDDGIAELYQARFEGSAPEVTAKDGVVTMRYPRRLWSLVGGEKRTADVKLNVGIPWRMLIQGSASEITAELGKLDLAELEIKGGMSMIRLELPAPSGIIPIRISGGASEIVVRRPAGVAARVNLKGWVSTFVFDDQTFSDMGNNLRLQSSGYEGTGSCYDIEVSSSASMVTITTD